MATRRSTRVTQVDPWILGGEGQLRDLLPLPPWVILFVIRPLSAAFKHYLIALTILFSIYLWWIGDVVWWVSFILFPVLVLLARTLIITLYLWYKNPTIPLIARRH